MKSTILRSGDTLVIKSLDRLSHNKQDIHNKLQFFKDNSHILGRSKLGRNSKGHFCLFKAKYFPARTMGPMRVARPVNKWYNDNRKQNSTAAAGSANSLPPAAGDAPPDATETLHRREYYTHFAPPWQENFPHCTGLL